MKKLTVITNKHGVVIGTQHGHGGNTDPATGITSTLVAGPDQAIYKIEYDVPLLRTGDDIDDFHRKLGEHLKSQKYHSK